MARKKTSENKLQVPREWTFRSRNVALQFDSHVREQLPWYELATGIVAQIARAYLPRGGVVIDVGASTGNIGRALAPLLEARRARVIPIDAAEEMKEVYDGPGDLLISDVAEFDFEATRPDLIVCFLSLMFVGVAERFRLINRMVASLRPGGAVIIFDKMVPTAGYIGTVAYRLTLAAKQEAGASPAEIVAKELSISGVQRPMRREEMEGFEEVFRFGDFAGFIRER